VVFHDGLMNGTGVGSFAWRECGVKTKPNGGDGSIAFWSTCPKCAQLRPQRGYNRDSLLRLLNRGHPVEAYCRLCDEAFAISVKERAGLTTLVLLIPA
jgi:hypothetical protein